MINNERFLEVICMTREEFHRNTVLAASVARSVGQLDASEALERIAILSKPKSSSFVVARDLRTSQACSSAIKKAAETT